MFSRPAQLLLAATLAGSVWSSMPVISAEQMPSRAALADGEPVARELLGSSTLIAPVLDLSAAITAKRATSIPEVRGGAMRLGSATDFTNTFGAVSWGLADAGRVVGRLQVRSAGAAGLRARLVLPAGLEVSEVRVLGKDARVEAMRVSSPGLPLWTPYTDGESQLVELVLPVGAAIPAADRIGIATVSHFDISPLQTAESVAKDVSGTCNPDVACTSTIPGLDAALAERKKSVIRLAFTSGTGTFSCTGTLINSDKFPRAFVLTANHCIATAAEAASLTTFWFYENAGCGQPNTVQGSVQVAGGSNVLLTNYMVDSSLLELNGTPPATAVYAGWDAAVIALNAPVVSVSHPRGDPMKYAEGTRSSLIRTSGNTAYDNYGVSFTRGVIEGGSSGSGLFTLSPNNDLQLRAILSGTTLRSGSGMSCTNTGESAIYGRFEIFQPNIRGIIQNVTLPGDADPNMPGPTARTIPLGGSVTARIDYSGDLDVFRINVTQAGQLTVRSTGGNDLVGALLNSSGEGLVAVDDVETANNEFGFTFRITTPGTYYVSVGHWAPGATSGDYQVSASFSSATTNFSDIWWNQAESGWGLALNHQDNTIAGALYTFAADGQPLFVILNGATPQPDGSYLGNLNRSTGPAFNAVPWSTSQVVNTVVGTMRLRFLGSQNLDIEYSINGTNVSKSLTRLRYGTAPVCNFSGFDRSTALNFQDIWWNPNESGWGLNIIHQDDVISVGLYNYDASGRDVWYLMAPGTRQTGTATYSGPLKRVTGPVFNSVPWTASQETTVGNLSINFTSGNQGTLTYSINGQTVVKPIQRLVFANPATECERD